MSQFKRWIPAGVATVVIAGVAVAVPLSATATSTLPTKSADEVIAMIGNSSVTALSGTVEQTSNLGLPSLPTTGTASAGGSYADSSVSSALELLTGSHTARVYLGGEGKARVQVLDQLAERDVVSNGSDVWLYDSKAQTATHTTLPAGSSTDALPSPTATPEELAQKFLDAVDPTTDVAVGGDVTVAGRSAYDLVLTPAAGDTLVGNVSIAVDSATGIPLRVEVTARGSGDPAFSTGFTSLSLDAPSADLFSFTPPAGTTVTEKALPTGSAKRSDRVTQDSPETRPTVTGTGWSSIVSVPAASAADVQSVLANPLVGQLTTAVDGGRLLQSTLVNVLLTADGRVFAGSVSADQLEAAAASAAQ